MKTIKPTTKKISVFHICLFILPFLFCSCGTLVLVESARLPFQGPVESNLVLTETNQDAPDDRLYMTYEFGKTSRSGIPSTAWVNPESFSFMGGRSTILYQKRVNDLFPTLAAWVGSNDQIRITSGNSYRRLSSQFFTLSETTEYWPELLGFQDKRYLIWWDDLDLKMGEYQGQGVLANVRTIVTRASLDFGLGGNFQPSVAVHNGEVFILTQLGGVSRGSNFVHLARSTDLTNWDHSFIELERNIAPRPVIVSYSGRLYIFYAGIVPNNIVRYLSSAEGNNWNEEQDLPFDTALDPTGKVGTLSGIGVARHFGKLAVVWVTDISSNDSTDDIFIGVYESSGGSN